MKIYTKLLVPFVLLGYTAVYGDDVRVLPQEGVTAESVRLKKQDGKLVFRDLRLSDFATIQRVEASTRKAGQTVQLPVENPRWTARQKPVDWIVVLDTSDSMRRPSNNGGKKAKGRNYLKEAIGVIKHIQAMITEGDTLKVLGCASEMKELGVYIPGQETALPGVLDQLAAAADSCNTRGHANTAYLQLTNSYLQAHKPAEGRAAAVVVLSDGDDDASADGSRMELVATAKASGIKVHCMAFWQKEHAKGANTLKLLAESTGGSFADYGKENTPCGKFCDTAKQRSYAGSFSLMVKPVPEDYDHLQLTFFKAGLPTGAGTLELTRDAVEKIAAGEAVPVVQSEPAVQDTEEDKLLKQIMDKDKLPAAAQAVKKVQEAEDLHASPEGIGKLVKEARDELTKLLPLVQKLHDSDVTAVEAAIDKAKKREGITPDELAYLNGLARICKDPTVTTVTEELLRKMLGREKDWPEAKVEAPAPTPWWMEPWVWGTAGGLALVVALLVLLQRRKNSQAPDVQEDPAPVKEVGDSRTEVVVARPVLADPAAGTPALIRIDDLESGKGWEITHEMVTVGRNKQNDIRIADASVSSHHCTIQRQRGGSWTITDVGSANGVYINKRLVKHTELQSGDVFQLGRVSLRITIL